MSPGVRRVVAGGAAGLVGLAALLVASHAGHGAVYWMGLGVFVLAVLGVFALMVRHFDEQEHGPGAPSLASRLLAAAVPEDGGQRYVSGAATAVLGLFGLFLASRGHPGETLYGAGLVIFALAVAYAFLLVRASVGPGDGETG